ncbi:MAG: DUF2520 domain-containing protein, partial [Bacteroidetes bacterium]|nr:DUF2520 domain-containing protein [Bacteroidota bacterium]
GYTSQWENMIDSAGIYVVAISDNSLLGLDAHLSLPNKLIVHTAGSVSKDVLKKISRNYGVVWPLQSVRKENDKIPEIPLLVDGNTEDDLTLIFDFAKTISDNVHIASDEIRLKLHTAAVFVNNFTNHLYALTEEYCKKENIDFNLLLPIIDETAGRLHFSSASQMQTGPAIRNDRATINRHLELLKNHPALKELYKTLTESIQKVNK